MKIVIVGGSGLIWSKVVTRLREQGHQAVPASPDPAVRVAGVRRERANIVRAVRSPLP